MATKYLDKTGLAYFWSKIKAYIASLLGSKADDVNVVHKTGGESIRGYKSFVQPSLIVQNPYVELGTFETSYENYHNNLEIFLADKNYDPSSGSVPIVGTTRLGEIQWQRRGSSGGDSFELTLREASDPEGPFVLGSIGIMHKPLSGAWFGYCPSTPLPSVDNTANAIVTRNFIPLDTRILHTSGNEVKTGSLAIQMETPYLRLCNTKLSTKGTTPNANYYSVISFCDSTFYDGSDTLYRSACVESCVTPENKSILWLRAYKWLNNTNIHADMAIVYPIDSDPYILGITPSSTADDSEKIPTTAWVRDATGNFACNAATATKLATARSLKTKLDSTTAVTFDGSAAQDSIPVTGTLAISNGGTAGTTREEAQNNLLYATTHTSGSYDFNDFRVSGINSFSSGTTLANCPNGANGILITFASAGIKKQFWSRLGTIDSNDHYLGFRTGGETVWSDWHKIYTDSDVIPVANGGTGSSTKNFVDLSTSQTIAGSKTFSDTISGATNGNFPLDGTYINSGTHDMNDYTSSGVWLFSTGATLSNVPIGSNGLLICVKSGASHVRQWWLRWGTNDSSDHQYYFRQYSGSSWSTWKKIYTSADTIPISNGGTGATTRLGALKALTQESVGTSATYFLTITNSWGKGGYTSVADAKTVLGLGSAAYTASTDYAAASHTHSYLPLSGGTVSGIVTISKSNSTVDSPAILMSGSSQNYMIDAVNTSVTKGTAPSANKYWGINFFGNDYDHYNKRIGLIETTLSTSNVAKTSIFAYNCTTNDNNNSCAIRAIVDGNGNAYTEAPTPSAGDSSTKIATTAYVQGEISGLAADSGVVHKTGAETVAGAKTFTDNVVVSKSTPSLAIKDSRQARGTAPTSDISFSLSLQDSSGSAMTALQSMHRKSGQIESRIVGYNQSGSWNTVGFYYPASGSPYGGSPTPDSYDYNDTKIATTAWVTGKIAASATTSDERKKTGVETVPDAVLDAWAEVGFRQFKYRDAVAEKGDNARLHLGVIAQRVIEAFERRGLDAAGYGLLCLVKQERASHWEDRFDENGSVVESWEVVDREADEFWGIRYAEALALECALARRENDRLKKRVSDLEDRLAALELRFGSA